MTDSRAIARTVLNTLKPGVGGCVWASFITRWGYPLVRIQCTLIHPDREMPVLKSDVEGLVYWPGVPLEDCAVRLELDGRSIEPDVPWLCTKSIPQHLRLMDAHELLGSPTDHHGVQARLLGLGYDCGPLDGIVGPKTRAAVKEFQRRVGLASDGKPGPITGAALADIFDAPSYEEGSGGEDTGPFDWELWDAADENLDEHARDLD